MTVLDPAFEGAGRVAGVEVWRIENFAPVKYPRNEYGKLYNGDSYIILNTKENGATKKLSWDIHFWLGADSSQDEKGTAAIKAVELDDMLGGLAVQYRETQEYESPAFLSCFKGGIRYVPGGVKSGFKHYNAADAPNRLFQVKGKRNVRVREVEASVKSMNKGDCYILDTPKKIYVYVGRYSKRTERLKAIQAANQIRDQDHGGKIKIEMIEPNSTPDTVAEYFTALGGGSRADMAEAEDDDDVYEKNFKSTVTLYRVSDSSGTVKVDKVAERPLKRDMLLSQDCFILDAGKSGIYVWIGKKCTKQEKLSSMKTAEGFLKQNGYPEWTRIQRVVDGGEPSSFKQIFLVWRESDDSPPIIGKVYSLEKIAASTSYMAPKIRDATHDRETLKKYMKNMGRAVGFCPDDGQGKTELWRIENFELAPVPADKHGLFFGGDSYVLKYTYSVRGRENYIVYFWQGTDSTQDERAAAALHAVAIDDKLNGRAVQVRVVQGHEPAHFLRVFKGKMVIFLGGHASGFRNVREHETYDATKPKLFHVQGTCEEDTRAIEILPKASSLDSDDCFVLDAPGVTYLWVGKGASSEEKAMAKKVDAIVSPGRDAIVVAEGAEPEAFWKLLGGKTDYARDTSEADSPSLSARLFHCSITWPSTKLKVDEIFEFTQEDLNEDDVMVLDTGADEIFIWLGNGATVDERKHSMGMSDEYIKSQHERLGGNAVSVSIVVKQGEEPESFKVLFPSWNDNMWQEQTSLDEIVTKLNEGIED